MTSFLSPEWLVVGAGLALLTGWLGSVFHLLRRQRSVRYRAGLILLNGLAALILWGIVAQPASRELPSGSAVLLTPGAGASLPPDAVGLPLISMGSGLHSGISRVSDLAALARSYPGLKNLIVSGYGLPLEDWRINGQWNIDFRPAELPPGFVDMQWRSEMVLGEQLHVSGRIIGSDSKNWQVRLLDPAGDTVEAVSPDDDFRFSLTAQPKSPGAVTYQLLGIDAAGEILLREPLPVWIRRPLPPRVLMLLTKPSFESRFLKNWLSTSTAGLALETRLSKEVRRVESMGDDPPSIEISEVNLRSVDLLVVDAGWLSDSGQSQRGAISRSVSAGLGLLVLMDATPRDEIRRSPMLADFDLQESYAPVAPLGLFAGSLQAEPPSLQMKAGAAEILFSSDQDTPLFAVRPQSEGQIGLSLLTDSFSWGANGHASDYGRLWQTAVARVARPRSLGIGIERSTPLLTRGDSVTVCENTGSKHGCRREWLDEIGWNAFNAAQNSVSVYAHSADHWRAWRAQITRRATRQVAQLAPPDLVLEHHLSPRFDPWLLWGMFISLTALIWLEHKFFSMEG